MIKLYTSNTPNGRKVSILLEELKVKYKTHLINLDKKEQFNIEFSKISPTNKIPVIQDLDNKQVVFESGAILIYLAQKYNNFLPKNYYWEVIQWVIFQVAYVGPMLGQAHQYLYYHSGKSEFAENKSKDYVRHIYKILDERLKFNEYIANSYSIADISIWPWVDRHERHQVILSNYQHVDRWYKIISKRPAVLKGYNVG
ncbi:glutathione S-transferase N-terminal domain-containing protein [Alphaproteobacteria bacterium]|nr:glutathione S-transferase N-terminal domain-containing protein [Alphaproteobacteria bacterium]